MREELRNEVDSMLEMGVVRPSASPYASTIHLTKGYWQIPVVSQDVYKAAFVTPDGQYEFLQMPFVMVNSEATLVRGLKKVLEGL